MDDTTHVLAQKRFLRGRLTLTLDGDKLKSEYRHGLSLRVYRFDLRFFLPDPVRARRVAIWRIVGAALLLGFGAMCLAMGVAEITSKERGATAMFIVAGVMLFLGGLASVSAAERTTNVVVLRGPGGQIVLWRGLPNREEFDKFMAVLIERIKESRDYEQSILRHLRQADIINDWQYDQAAEFLRKPA